MTFEAVCSCRHKVSPHVLQMDQLIFCFSVNLRLIYCHRLPWLSLLLGALVGSTRLWVVPHKYPLLCSGMSYDPAVVLVFAWSLWSGPPVVHLLWSMHRLCNGLEMSNPILLGLCFVPIACRIFSIKPLWHTDNCHSIPKGVCSSLLIQPSCVICWLCLLIPMPVSTTSFSPCGATDAICSLNLAGGSVVASPTQWNAWVLNHLGYMPCHVYPSSVQWYRAFSCAW